MLPAPQKYATWLAVIRIYTGIFWLTHGVPKLLNPGFAGNGMADMVREASATTTGPYHDFIVHVVLPNATLFGHLVAWGETLTGVSLLLGLLTQVGGVVGFLLPLNYFLMKGSYAHVTTLGGLDAAAMALSFINIVLPTGLTLGLDSMLPASRLRPRSAGKTSA
ncbi:MAG TPA: DoxX family membrane protein [Candidatus Eremiobacteraceae bacterium]|jgi:uncharacterized membrane protein YphA (DoxX/SURF4 family)|nr:DoxX family membrane protein [Candidatus Eremiobacteraceae bacterium]